MTAIGYLIGKDGVIPDDVTDLAEPDPLVLTLPQVFEIPQPPPSVKQVKTDSGRLIVRMGGDHWLDSQTAALHRPDDQVGSSWNNLLASHRRLTDATPPREPRTWEQYDIGVTDLPKVVDVEGDGRWRRIGGDGLYVRQHRYTRYTLSTLATFGKITEVFDAEHS